MANPTSVRMGDETDRMLGKLAAHFSTSQAAVLRMAVKALYRREQKNMVSSQLVVRFSDDGLWGSTDPDREGYDASQSAASFETTLQARLRSEYPDWDVTVDNGLEDDARLDNLPDFEERPAVDDIIHEVWESMAWAVKGSA